MGDVRDYHIRNGVWGEGPSRELNERERDWRDRSLEISRRVKELCHAEGMEFLLVLGNSKGLSLAILGDPETGKEVPEAYSDICVDGSQDVPGEALPRIVDTFLRLATWWRIPQVGRRPG